MAPRVFEKTREIALSAIKKSMGHAPSSGSSGGPSKSIKIFRSLIESKTVLVLFMGVLVGDLIANLAVNFIPAARKGATSDNMTKSIPFLRSENSYQNIISNNIFCPTCPPPPALVFKAIERPKDCNNASPFRDSSLKLIGTIVLSKSEHSVATISGGSSESKAYKTGESVSSFGKIFEIRRTRVCIENSEGILNYIELPKDNVITFGESKTDSMGKSQFEGISARSDTEFEVKKSFITQKLNDPNLLFQAHAVLHMENGVPAGFKILSIDPGSVYEALGLKPGDVLKGVNDSPLTSIPQVQELYQTIGNAKDVNIEVVRDGRPLSLNYNVTN